MSAAFFAVAICSLWLSTTKAKNDLAPENWKIEKKNHLEKAQNEEVTRMSRQKEKNKSFFLEAQGLFFLQIHLSVFKVFSAVSMKGMYADILNFYSQYPNVKWIESARELNFSMWNTKRNWIRKVQTVMWHNYENL